MKRWNLTSAILVGTNFHCATFRHCTLDTAIFEGANISQAGFENCSLNDTTLSKVAAATGTRFISCQMSRLNMRDKRFESVRFERCNLQKGDFRDAFFESSELTVRPPGFINCNLDGALFDRTQLHESVLFENNSGKWHPRTFPSRVRPEIKILLFASNPAPTEPLKLAEEARAIEQTIRRTEHRDMLTFRTRWAVRIGDIFEALHEEKPTIVQFSTHGTLKGDLVLGDEQGQGTPVAGAALKQLMEPFDGHVRMLVLNACNSATHAKDVAQAIDFVISMKADMSDTSAIVFSSALYRAIGFGWTVQASFTEACNELALGGLGDDDVPSLHVRKGIDASSVVLTDLTRG